MISKIQSRLSRLSREHACCGPGLAVLMYIDTMVEHDTTRRLKIAIESYAEVRRLQEITSLALIR